MWDCETRIVGKEGSETYLEDVEEDDCTSAFHHTLVFTHAFEEGREFGAVPFDDKSC